MKKLYESIEALPEVFTTIGATEAINDAFDSFKCFINITANILSSEPQCKKLHDEFWYLHSALSYYDYDAVMLLRHSLLSAFTSYYSTAYSELRASIESIIRGLVFDLLAIPNFRNNAKELTKIEGHRGASGFLELLTTLNKELKDSRPKSSAKIFDIIDSKLKDFNPQSAFTRLILQLKTWNIIGNEEFKELLSYYEELSKYSHRPHPKFSDVGIRVTADKDWLELEPVPEELFIFLARFADINGWFTYLILKAYNIDLADSRYLKCVNWKAIKELVSDIEELAKTYRSWQKVKEIINKIETAYNSINRA